MVYLGLSFEKNRHLVQNTKKVQEGTAPYSPSPRVETITPPNPRGLCGTRTNVFVAFSQKNVL